MNDSETQARIVRLAVSPRHLHLILLPTEACNFRCVYCYEDFRLARMQRSVVDGVKRLLERRAPELDGLNLSWFGGEPLLAYDTIVELLEHVRALRAGRPGLQFSSDLTTNAWHLTRERFERLSALGVQRTMISFDGPPEFHDRKRLTASGQPTFARVWSNVRALRDVAGEFSVLVRLHLDRDNAHAAGEFFAMFQDAFGGDARFRLFVRQLSRLGGPNDERLAVFDKDAARALIEAFRTDADGRAVAQYRPDADAELCYAARANSFVIRADGRVNKCTVVLEEAANQIGRLTADGELALDQRAVQPWLRGLWSSDAAALECPVVGWLDGQERPEPQVAAG
jgi:uncharacterized protein